MSQFLKSPMASSLFRFPQVAHCWRAFSLFGWMALCLLGPSISGFGQMATARKGLLHTEADIAKWKQRMAGGPYRNYSDAFMGSPADADRITYQAEQYRRDPFAMEDGKWSKAQIWKGSADPGQGSPVYEGIGMQSAAFCAMLWPDSVPMQQLGALVVAGLRRQLAQPNIQVAAWPKNLFYELGTKEAVWMSRMIYTADFLGPNLPPTLADSLRTFLNQAAGYYMMRIRTGPIQQCFPQRGLANYDVKGRDAKPGQPYGLWAKGKYTNGDVYTHVNPNGSLGNRIPVLGPHWSNRAAEKVALIGNVGLWCGNAPALTEAIRWNQEWMRYSVFPDGTSSEYMRNGDYSNAGQGFWYNCLIIQEYLLLAEALRLRGDNSLYTYATCDGMFGTECLPGQAPKSIKMVLDRLADHCTGKRPIYDLVVGDTTRIDNNNERRGVHAPWDMLLAVGNRYFREPYYQRVYERKEAGTMPIPPRGLATAAKVAFPWGGTCAELPAILLMFGE